MHINLGDLEKQIIPIASRESEVGSQKSEVKSEKMKTAELKRQTVLRKSLTLLWSEYNFTRIVFGTA